MRLVKARISLSKFVLFLSVLPVLSACAGDKNPMTMTMGKMLERRPEFGATSKEAVRLQYKFSKGSSYRGQTEFQLDTTARQGKHKLSVTLQMRIHALYTVRTVSADQVAEVEMRVKRIEASSRGLKVFSYDSQRDIGNKRPEFLVFNTLIDAPILLKIKPNGKIVSTDTSGVEKRLEKVRNKLVLEQLRNTTRDISRSALVPLGDTAVKAGDVIKAGVVVSPLPNVGRMHMNVDYKILAVSGDRSKVLLQPVISYRIEHAKQSVVNMKIGSSEISSWILFDVNKGTVVKSAARTKVSLIANTQGRQVLTTVRSRVGYRQM